MPPDNPAKITIKRRERKAEISALISDLDRIAGGGAAFRLVAGRFGTRSLKFRTPRRSTSLLPQMHQAYPGDNRPAAVDIESLYPAFAKGALHLGDSATNKVR
jgi:hypothetical protein